MNLKRVLVLVMALVMVASACAPSVLALTETTHEHNHTSEGLGLVDKYRDIKDVVAGIVEDVVENRDEYYAKSYAYLVDNGCVAEATGAIELALEKLGEIDLGLLGATPETEANLANELGEVKSALEGLKTVLNDGTAGNLDAFTVSILSNVGELYVHIDNIYAINDQLMVDYDRDDVVAHIENVIIPKVEALVEEYDETVIAFAKEYVDPYAAKVVEIYGISVDAYELLVEIVMTVELYVDGTVDALIFVQNAIVDGLISLYDMAYPTLKDEILSFDYSVENLYAILEATIDAAVKLDRYVEIGLDNLDKLIVWAADTYVVAVEIVEEVGGDVVNAATVVTQLYDYVLDVDYLLSLAHQGGELLAADVYTNVVEILNDSYEQDGDIYFIAARLSAYVMGRLDELDAFIKDLHENALNGSYELKDDSYYVALGSPAYAEKLAEKLNLGAKHEVVSLSDNYLEALSKADLVTLKLDNGDMVELLETQLLARAAEIISANPELMAWYKTADEIQNSNAPKVIKDGFAAAKLVVDGIVDLDAKTVELDWDKYLDAEGQAALDALLASVEEKLVENGVCEYYYFDFNPIIEDVFEEYGLGGIFTFSFTPVEIPVSELVVFALENAIYSYAEMVEDLMTVIDGTDATVVLTKMGNPLVDYSYAEFSLSEYAEYAEPVVDALNAHLYAFAFANENVIFVNSEDANDIYDALHVYCDHVYDDCEDEECNRCLAVRMAPGHSFTNYVFEASTSCKENGTETAKCDNCDAIDTRTVPNTKGPHDWKDATCSSPKKCAVCGATEGQKLEHVFGDWKKIKEPTTKEQGIEERACANCGHIEMRFIPNTGLSIIAIVAIVLCAIAVIAGGVVAILYFKKKKVQINNQ